MQLCCHVLTTTLQPRHHTRKNALQATSAASGEQHQACKWVSVELFAAPDDKVQVAICSKLPANLSVLLGGCTQINQHSFQAKPEG
jgi:hypothetical protein